MVGAFLGPAALALDGDDGCRRAGRIRRQPACRAARVRIFEIGADYILGSMADDLGIESVQLWSLDRDES